MKKYFFCFLITSGIFVSAFSQEKNRWVDSVFQSMTQEDKIGQLFMITVSHDNYNEIQDEIKNHQIGGIVFKDGGPVWQAKLTRKFQELSAVPMFIGLDTEWKQGISVDSAANFPSPVVLGAIDNDSLIYAIARETGRGMREIGININFDLPTEIRDYNESIEKRNRSFGSGQVNVADKAIAYMNGLEDEGVISCAKNFTLKGLTIVGIQDHLPVIQANIDSVKAFPFQQLIQNKLLAVQPAPVDLPLFYEKKKQVKKNALSTGAISILFSGAWMKTYMEYEGLAFVDIAEARKVGGYRSGEAETMALQAGNDIFISPEGIGGAIRKIKKFLRKQPQYAARLDSTVKRVLAFKYDAGINRKREIRTDNLVARISSIKTKLFKQRLFQEAITITHDRDGQLPIRSLENKRIAYLTQSDNPSSDEFFHYLSKYAGVSKFVLEAKNGNTDAGPKNLSNFDVIIVGIFPDDSFEKILPAIKNLSVNHSVIACDFGHEKFLMHAEEFPSAITAYANDPDLIKDLPQVIFGALRSHGVLPYTISETLKQGTGFKSPALNRFIYTIPEEAGMDSKILNKIDKIAQEAIQMGATPGCNVFVAKDGKVVFERSYGYLTYDKKTPVTDKTIYDLASVTKVSATLQAVMFMYEKGLIDINRKASYYLPELKNSNKKDFTIKDILTHQAGLWPFLPFWAQTMKDSVYLPEFYNRERSDQYPFLVADHLYASASMGDSLWSWIVKAKVRDKPDRTPFDYRYSDMGFYIMQHLAERLLNQPIEDFLEQNLYGPLGASTTGYLPLQRFMFTQIAPTENDKLFRKSLLTGVVHDQGAAMLGGIAGHAGLFSTANDLAKLGQMLLQEGSYGGYRYYKPQTVKLFTQKAFENSRRGLGWDKPTQSDPNGPTSLYASPKTFGHTGFTGTCIWVDPEFNVVYVFLSNRVHPDMTNNKLINANIRSRIQDVIYESIFNYCQFSK